MLRWIDEVVVQGIRRPGYPADRWAEEFIFDKFEHLGLQSVRFESVEAALWKDSHALLKIVAGQRTTEFECFAVPMSEPTGVEGPLTRWDPADPAGVAGQGCALRASVRLPA